VANVYIQTVTLECCRDWLLYFVGSSPRSQRYIKWWFWAAVQGDAE